MNLAHNMCSIQIDAHSKIHLHADSLSDSKKIKESDTNKICLNERLVMNFEGVVVFINALNKELKIINGA